MKNFEPIWGLKREYFNNGGISEDDLDIRARKKREELEKSQRLLIKVELGDGGTGDKEQAEPLRKKAKLESDSEKPETNSCDIAVNEKAIDKIVEASSDQGMVTVLYETILVSIAVVPKDEFAPFLDYVL